MTRIVGGRRGERKRKSHFPALNFWFYGPDMQLLLVKTFTAFFYVAAAAVACLSVCLLASFHSRALFYNHGARGELEASELALPSLPLF